VKSRTTRRFRAAFDALPEHVQRQARESYRLFSRDPFHPGLRFKQVHPTRPIYSTRISADYRALGPREGDELIWFWIGSHAEYDRLLSQMQPSVNEAGGYRPSRHASAPARGPK
jgi:hypothetical protein